MSRWSEACEECPEKPLELWNYDGNQFARLVREALCELELPYISRSAGKVPTYTAFTIVMTRR